MLKQFLFLFLATTIILLTACGDDNDNDGNPEIVGVSISGVTISEGDLYRTATIKLQLDNATSAPVSAFISSADVTAEAGADYVSFTDEAINFAIGETEKEYQVVIIGDRLVEEDETFKVTITSVTGPATITTAEATVGLTNDDAAGIKRVNVEPEIDWSALLNLPIGSEPPYAVFNFGQPPNVPNSEYTSIAALGDSIILDFTVSPSGDTILYFDVVFEGIDPNDLEEFFDSDELPPFTSPSDSLVYSAYLVPIVDDDVVDLTYKYDLIFYIGQMDGTRKGPYTIDPKIRIPRR